eukprot:2807221-Rhodomonas_salina.1
MASVVGSVVAQEALKGISGSVRSLIVGCVSEADIRHGGSRKVHAGEPVPGIRRGGSVAQDRERGRGSRRGGVCDAEHALRRPGKAPELRTHWPHISHKTGHDACAMSAADLGVWGWILGGVSGQDDAGAAGEAELLPGRGRGDRVRDAQELGDDGRGVRGERRGALHGHGRDREVEPEPAVPVPPGGHPAAEGDGGVRARQGDEPGAQDQHVLDQGRA